MPLDIASTRALAARSLDRVLNEGAYSNVVVANQAVAEQADRRLYQRLVFESLRYLPAIDEAIDRATSRRLDRIQRDVLAVLRIATAEVRYLSRPPHSAVSGAVEAVREIGKPKAAGFVNGVMRAVVRDLDDSVASERYLGMPRWLYDRLVSVLGDDADAFITASNTPPRTGIRSRDGQQRGEASDIEGAAYMEHHASVGDLVVAGALDVIDPASVAVVNALDVDIGDRVLDLAAAPGGKTRAIVDRIAPDGHVIACDIHVRRLWRAERRSRALSNVTWIVADATSSPFRDATFDKILLDAPCTGVGTLRRRPEIRYRIDEEAPSRYGALQRLMLKNALRLLQRGGRLVYSVCTLFPEETSDVVADLGAVRPSESTGIPWGDGSLLAPHITGTDGMFIAVFDR